MATDPIKEVAEPRATDRSKPTLHRVLGLPTGILLVAGVMIGSGAFKKIVPMAQTLPSETWILMAWVIAGGITMLGAFTYAGLASLTEDSGGQYEYLRLCYGPFFSFLFGWTIFMMGGSGAIAALAFIFSQSVNTIIPLGDPLHGISDLSIGNFIYPFASSGVKIFALATIAVLTWINYRSVRNGGILNNIVTIAKIGGILFLIVLGLSYAKPDMPVSAANDEAEPLTGGLLVSGLFGAMLSALWAYDGWANITYITGEIKNPKRNLPLAIIAGLGIAMTLYVLLNYSYMHVMPLDQLAALGENKIAAAEVAGRVLGNPGKMIIAVLIMICTFGALNVCIIVYPRVYFRMAEERYFFPKAARVHPVFRTPHIALLYSSTWSAIMVITGTFDLLTNLVIFSGYLFFGLIAWGVIKMRRKGVITGKIIGYPWAPVIIVLFSIVLIVNTCWTAPLQSLMGFALVLSGLPFYFIFRKSNKL